MALAVPPAHADPVPNPYTITCNLYASNPTGDLNEAGVEVTIGATSGVGCDANYDWMNVNSCLQYLGLVVVSCTPNAGVIGSHLAATAHGPCHSGIYQTLGVALGYGGFPDNLSTDHTFSGASEINCLYQIGPKR